MGSKKTKTNLILGLALVLVAGIFIGYSLIGYYTAPPAEAPRGELPLPAVKPIVFTQSSWGGSDKDLIAISALPPFEVLKTWGPLDVGGSSMNPSIFTADNRYGYFQLGPYAPLIAQVELSTLKLNKIAVGGGNDGNLTASSDGKYLYHEVDDTGVLQKIDALTGKIVDQIRLDEIYKGSPNWGATRVIPGKAIHSMLITPDKKSMYITFQWAPGYTYGPGDLAGGAEGGVIYNRELAALDINVSTWKIDLDKFEVVKKIDLGRKGAFHGGSGMTLDGKYIYGAGGSAVYVIDTAKDEVVKMWDDGMGNHGAYIQPDGKYVWASQGDPQGGGGAPTNKTKIFDPEIWIIDTATNERIKRIPVSKSPHWIDFTPDSKYAVVDADQSDYVQIFDVKKQELIKQIAVGNRAQGKATPEGVQGSWHPRISPDGKYVYVAIAYADALEIVDVEQGKVIKTIKVGPRPHQAMLFWPGYSYNGGWLPGEVPESIKLR